VGGWRLLIYGSSTGHNTGLGYAARWITTFLGPRLHENNFIKDTLFVITFDEDDYSHDNHVYTLLLGIMPPIPLILMDRVNELFAGPMVQPNSYESTKYDHYSLLRTVEYNWGLGHLGRNDTNGNTFVPALTRPVPYATQEASVAF
jgi:acid phosphatase